MLPFMLPLVLLALRFMLPFMFEFEFDEFEFEFDMFEFDMFEFVFDVFEFVFDMFEFDMFEFVFDMFVLLALLAFSVPPRPRGSRRRPTPEVLKSCASIVLLNYVEIEVPQAWKLYLNRALLSSRRVKFFST